MRRAAPLDASPIPPSLVMASTSRLAPSSPHSLDSGTDRAGEWFRAHGRALGAVGVTLAAVLGGAMVWLSSNSGKATRADAAFAAASAPLATNDVATAQRELRQVATQYDGTAGGAQAQLLLAQLLYDAGKYQEGLDVLKQADDAPAPMRTGVLALTAAGYEGLDRFGEAGKRYEDAAAAASTEAQKRDLRANAARAYQRAGDVAASRRLWEPLANEESSPYADEARVRLGELAGLQAGGGAAAPAAGSR